jgi:hypothetical protein
MELEGGSRRTRKQGSNDMKKGVQIVGTIYDSQNNKLETINVGW